jgi:hypothetical protein
VTQDARPNPYSAWKPNTAYNNPNPFASLTIEDPNGYLQWVGTFGTTGGVEPNPWNQTIRGTTQDGSVRWQNIGRPAWAGNNPYNVGAEVTGNVIDPTSGLNVPNLFVAIKGGDNGAVEPTWLSGPGALVPDGDVTWQNAGNLLHWADIGATTNIVNTSSIVDSNGYLQNVLQNGKSGDGPVIWQTEPGAITQDGSMFWLNSGPFASGTTAPWLYGYAYQNSVNTDLSEMSPPSLPISVSKGGQVIIQGVGTGQGGVDTIVLYRTAQGGSTFLYLDEIPNPGEGVVWTYTDTHPDSDLNTELQAQVGGEGTPLPTGATCLGYHLTRIFAAVGNVVYISSGPDAVASGSNGNAGFDTAFTAQSKITRFWACSLGMVVFTVRDAYIILGSATDADPLYMVVFIEDLPLKSYDHFTVNKTTPYLFMGNGQLVSLDPSAGIIEVGFPIADKLEDGYNPASYLTFHSQSSRDTALYVTVGGWYRMSQNNAPEQGSAWSTLANPAGFELGCIQSVEVTPGSYRLLICDGTATRPILQRDRSASTDNGITYAAQAVFGSIVLAQPGQLAALSFITLESVRAGTRPELALLLGEIEGTFEPLTRTRQDPPILPPSQSLYSDRYHFAQNQKEAWCRHFQRSITWAEEDAQNELLTFTIFGQTWQEMRSQ